MTDLNFVVVEGRLTSDVSEKDFGFLSTGTAKLIIHLACNKSIKKGEEWVDETSFFDVTVWGKYAENIKAKVVKGATVLVKGALKQDRWEDANGNKKSKVYINAESVKIYPKEQKQSAGGFEEDYPAEWR